MDPFRYRGVLKDRHIHVSQAWSFMSCAAEVSIGPNRGQDESVGIEPLSLIPENDGPREGRVQGRAIGISCVAVSQTVRAEQGSEGETRQQSRDPVHLPAADELLRDARAGPAKRQFVGDGHARLARYVQR